MRTALLGFFTTALIAVPTTAFSETIHACVKNNGKLRIVAEGTVCKKEESPISWNQKGPKGDAGVKGDPGPPAETLSVRQLIGFTEAEFPGDSGVLTFNTACGVEFERSTMCTSVEVMTTETAPLDPEKAQARYKKTADRAHRQSMLAIELKCIECCTYEHNEAKKCEIRTCALWALNRRIFGP